MNSLPQPPSIRLALTEVPRASYESLLALSGMNRLVRKHQSAGAGHPVLVLPGYGAADGSTAILRYFLKRIGFKAFALELGRNVESVEDRIQSVDDATRFREKMVDLVVDRVRHIYQETGETISLVGWSMGGLYAVDASKVVPKLVQQVVTLGSPFGDPRGTSLFRLMRRLSRSNMPLDAQNFAGWLEKANASEVPTKVVYSARDGIVGEAIARLPESPNIEHCQINSSHIGFALNLSALNVVASTLASAQKRSSFELAHTG